MISFTVRFQFRPEDHAAVEEHLRVLSLATRQEPGCVNYIGHFVLPESGSGSEDQAAAESVVIYEQYLDEAAVEHHRNTAHFAEHANGGLYRLMVHRQIEHLAAVC